MGNARLRVLRAVPGSTSVRPIVRDFCAKGTGVVTSFSDSRLRSLHDEVGDESTCEVLAFGKLVANFLELCGEESLAIAPAPHVLAAIAQACTELTEESPFWRTSRFPGLHEAIQRALSDLHHWGIGWEELLRLAEQSEGRLAAKLRSLAQIDKEVHRILGLLGRQTHFQHLKACLECTPERDGAYERILAFVGADDSPLKLRWLRWAAEQGTEVTVVLDRHASGGEVFAGARRAESILEVEPRDIGDGNRLLRNLFGESPSDGPEIEVVVASAADPLAECEWALREVMEDFGRCAIYTRSLETYAPLLESVSRRLRVPLQMARRAPLMTNAFARMILTALEFIAGDDVRHIGSILRSSYFGFTIEQRNAISQGLKECHATRDLQWLTLRTFAETKAESSPWLLFLVQWRQDHGGENLTLADWVGRLRHFLDEMLGFVQTEVGDRSAQERDRRARNRLEQILASHASIERACELPAINLRQFVDVCRRLWEPADVSVPCGDFGVTVTGNAEGLEDADTVVVLGMLEGVFPRRRTEDPVLTDFERLAISALRPEEPALPTSHDVAEGERDTFYRVCASARRRLVCSYPQVDESRDNVPAFYLELVRRASGNATGINYGRDQLAPALETCRTPADEALRNALDGPKESSLPIELVTERIKELLRRRDMAVAPAELRDAHLCGFQYICRHRLNLRPKRPSTRWALLRQLPQKASLPKHVDPEFAEGALIEALEAELDRLYSDIPEWEVQLLRSGGRRLIQEWIAREFRAKEIWPKNDDSLRLNVGFGDHGTRSDLWHGISLQGVLPAVSQIDAIPVAHLYAGSIREPDRMTDTDRMYLGLHMAALNGRGAVEMESTGGKRMLYVLGRGNARHLISDTNLGLHVVDLATSEDASQARQQFYEKLKDLVRIAAERIRDGIIEVHPGDHCEWCDFGELCRRSKMFGEEDSPFGYDRAVTDV